MISFNFIITTMNYKSRKINWLKKKVFLTKKGCSNLSQPFLSEYRYIKF